MESLFGPGFRGWAIVLLRDLVMVLIMPLRAGSMIKGQYHAFK